MTRTLLRGGCVLTLGTKTPNHPEADILLEDDRIAEIGPGLRARDAEVIEATDTIVMPGFVDAHRHAWRSLFRNAADVDIDRAAKAYTPDDVYAATLIALLGAIEAGVTTVVDWADVATDDARVDAALQAHADAGVRTVFVPPGPGERGPSRIASRGGTPTTSVAFGAEIGTGFDAGAASDAWAAGRASGRRIHAHATTSPASGTIAELSSRGLLGDDVTVVHAAGLGADALDAIAARGAAICLTPAAEMAGGSGSPPIQQLLDRDLRPALGVDDERIAPGDLFAQMRETISLQHATVFDRKLIGKAGLPRLMNTRDVIRCATVESARAAGLRGVVGSLEVGMQADLIVLRTDRPNVFPINDPIGAVVWGMDTSNVDRVIVAGRTLMRDGALEADVARARELATSALARVMAASGTVPAAAGGAR